MNTFRFSLDSFEILTTRSLFKDTDTVGLSFAIVGQGGPQVKTLFMGDVDNGFHNVNLVFDNIQLADTDKIVISYHIANNGGNPSNGAAYVKDTLAKLTDAGVTAAANAGTSIGTALGIPDFISGPALKALFKWLTGKIWNIVFANCDGPVAVAIYTFTGADLKNMLSNNSASSRREHHIGIDSNAGCGNNSDYFVTWSMVWTNKPIQIDPCQAQLNEVNKAQAEFDSLKNDIKNLQLKLHQGGSKAGIISLLIDDEDKLTSAQDNLQIAQQALVNCRMSHVSPLRQVVEGGIVLTENNG